MIVMLLIPVIGKNYASEKIRATTWLDGRILAFSSRLRTHAVIRSSPVWAIRSVKRSQPRQRLHVRSDVSLSHRDLPTSSKVALQAYLVDQTAHHRSREGIEARLSFVLGPEQKCAYSARTLSE